MCGCCVCETILDVDYSGKNFRAPVDYCTPECITSPQTVDDGQFKLHTPNSEGFRHCHIRVYVIRVELPEKCPQGKLASQLANYLTGKADF